MAIKLMQDIDLPPLHICPTCLKPKLFRPGNIGKSVRSTILRRYVR